MIVINRLHEYMLSRDSSSNVTINLNNTIYGLSIIASIVAYIHKPFLQLNMLVPRDMCAKRGI